MTIALAVFDVAGTTVRDDEVVLDAVMTAFAKHGLHPDREAVNRYMGTPKPEMIARFAVPSGGNGAAVADPRDIHATFREEIARAYRDGPVEAIPGAVTTFRRLRDRGVRVALDTGFDRETLDLILGRLGWGPELLDCTVSSDEVARGRPYPYLIFRAMERSGIASVREVAKLGDTPADVQEGRAAGCAIVAAVLSGAHRRETLELEHPTHVIATVADAADLVLGVRA